MARILIMDEKDNVATAVSDIAPGDTIEVTTGKTKTNIKAIDPVPFGHKIAIRPIPSKSKILKYGETIGTATKTISAGAHVHVHNLKSTRR